MTSRNDLVADFRFMSREDKRKDFLAKVMETMTPQELKKIAQAAEKLEIEDYATRPAVDVLYDIAGRLSILEQERIAPDSIMDAINKFLESN